MTPKLAPDRLAFFAVIVLLLVGCTQWGRLEVRLAPHVPPEVEADHPSPPDVHHGYPAGPFRIYPGWAKVPWGARNSPHIAIADPLLAALFGIWLLRVLVRREWARLRAAPIQFWAVPVIAIVAVGQAVNLFSPTESPGVPKSEWAIMAAVPEMGQFVLYFIGAYLLFVNGLVAERQRRAALYVFLAIVTANILVGIHAALMGHIPGPKEPFALFGSRYAYAGLVTIALPLVLGLGLRENRTWHIIWFALLLVLGLMSILSGAHLIILAIVLIAVSGLHSRRAVVIAALVAILGFAAFPAVYPLQHEATLGQFLNFQEPTTARTQESFPEGTVIKRRWLEWQAAVGLIGDPGAADYGLGVGTGNYQKRINSYYGSMPNQDTMEADTYSRYLVQVASMGFIGLVALCAALGCAWRHARSAASATGGAHPGLSLGLQGAILGVILANVCGDTFVRGLYVPMFFLFALAAATAYAAGGDEGMTDEA